MYEIDQVTIKLTPAQAQALDGLLREIYAADAPVPKVKYDELRGLASVVRQALRSQALIEKTAYDIETRPVTRRLL